nr:hypothetical protein [Tanacetum cinerariifolium]
MSARYLRKVLKEQEESSAAPSANNKNSSSDDDESQSPQPFINPFDLLNDNDQDQESDSNDADTSTTVKNEDSTLYNKKNAGTTIPSSNKKSKKKKNKKKNKESSSSTNDANSFDAILEELSLDNELRRIFGSKVVDSVEKSNQAGSSRQNRQGRRVFHPHKKTITVSPSEHWPRWDGSLSMELLENKGGCYYFRYVPSSTYSMAQRQFEQAQATHDLNGIASLLMHHPYHIDSLITLADYFKFSGEPQMSADATAKSLYALECAWHPTFNPLQECAWHPTFNPLQGNCQLKYTHDTNKPLFTSLFAHMKNMDRRGCHRSALEICKLLISLDSDDPMGALFCIDYLALRAEEYKWLERFSEEYNTDNSMWLFPNFSYSLAICRFYLEREETSETKSTSSDLMKQALMLHPSVLKKLVAKVPLKEQVWTKITNHSFFGKDQTGSESLDHLINIYVERSYIVWRLPELHNFLKDTALSVIEKMETSQSEARDWACVRKEAFPSEKNEYSHLMVSDFSDSTPTMPPENLQNFMIDPRLVDLHNAGGADNQENGGGGVARPPPREVANRNALAVLFESILPWVDYGAREEDHENGQQQDNQD